MFLFRRKIFLQNSRNVYMKACNLTNYRNILCTKKIMIANQFKIIETLDKSDTHILLLDIPVTDPNFRMQRTLFTRNFIVNMTSTNKKFSLADKETFEMLDRLGDDILDVNDDDAVKHAIEVFYHNESLNGLAWVFDKIMQYNIFHEMIQFLILLHLKGNSNQINEFILAVLNNRIQHDLSDFFYELFEENDPHQYDHANKLLRLVNMKPDKLKLDLNKENYLFSNICGEGNLELVKYIIKVGEDRNNLIDIHANGDDAFFQAFYNEQYDVCKWLVELSKSGKYGRFHQHIVVLL